MLTIHKAAVTAAATAIAVVAAATPASAAPLTMAFAAGQVCDFPLTVTAPDDTPTVYREFVDRDGRVRATLSAGKGLELTYTNVATGATFSTRANGAVNRTVRHVDGSMTMHLSGHNAVFLFPSDSPGPAATLYTGHAVIEVDAVGNWEVTTVAGRSVDLCATLS